MIQHFKTLGIPTAIATGSAQSSYKKKVMKYGHLFDWMSHVVCSDDPEVKHGKPSPDTYLLAAARFKTPPQSSSNVSYGWWKANFHFKGNNYDPLHSKLHSRIVDVITRLATEVV